MARFVSIFSGAGGLDLGLERAGWECLFATDRDPFAVKTLLENQARQFDGQRVMSDTVVHEEDVVSLRGRDILSMIGRKQGDIELLAGGPPCQSWSSAGRQRGFDDPRGRLVAEYLRLAGELAPRWLLFENVRGLLTARGWDGLPGSALALLREQLLELGWQTKVDLFNAADFGVPQRRVRLILIGHRAGDEPPLALATHAQRPSAGLREWRSLAAALAAIGPIEPDELITPSAKLLEQLADLKPGSGVKSPGKAEATRPGGHWGYKQGAFLADPKLPARTVTASAQQDWIRDSPFGIRRLSDRECAAIQTFPPGWRFAGGRTTRYRLIGNAVPPLLGEALGKALLPALSRTPGAQAPMEQVTPLPPRLQSAITYTVREELRNGPSRRLAPVRR